MQQNSQRQQQSTPSSSTHPLEQTNDVEDEAFALFRQEILPTALLVNPNTNMNKVSQHVKNLWNSLMDNQRTRFYAQVEEQKTQQSKKQDDADCIICMGPLRNPAVLDSCVHIFCFECIVEWGRSKPTCPLCTKVFLHLKSNFNINKEQKILPNWSLNGIKENIIDLRSYYELPKILEKSFHRPNIEKRRVAQVVAHIWNEIQQLYSYSFDTMGSQAIYLQAIEELQEEYEEYNDLKAKFDSIITTRSQLFNDLAFRRIVYLQKLVASSICTPVCKAVVNTEYFEANRDLMYQQLQPFVRREMHAVSRKNPTDTALTTFMGIVLDYCTAKINHAQIFNFLSRYEFQSPNHFLYNLLHFTRTGQSLHVYEQNTEYYFRPTINVATLLGDVDDDIAIVDPSID